MFLHEMKTAFNPTEHELVFVFRKYISITCELSEPVSLLDWLNNSLSLTVTHSKLDIVRAAWTLNL